MPRSTSPAGRSRTTRTTSSSAYSTTTSPASATQGIVQAHHVNGAAGCSRWAGAHLPSIPMSTCWTALPGPGPVRQHHRPRRQDPPPGEEVRDSGGNHQRTHLDPGHWGASVVRVLLVAVRDRLLEPVPRPFEALIAPARGIGPSSRSTQGKEGQVLWNGAPFGRVRNPRKQWGQLHGDGPDRCESHIRRNARSSWKSSK
jgi:hypothetical protein